VNGSWFFYLARFVFLYVLYGIGRVICRSVLGASRRTYNGARRLDSEGFLEILVLTARKASASPSAIVCLAGLHGMNSVGLD
jgi:hypothetical protein